MARRILIVDDDVMSREVLRDQLEAAGYEVFLHPVSERINGAMIRGRRPPLVLCGLDLPGVAPERFAPLVQNLRGGLGVRTLLISNLAPAEIAARARIVGADGWFEKSRLFFDAQQAVQEALQAAEDATRRVTVVQEPGLRGLHEAPAAAAAAARELVERVATELEGFHERAEPRAAVELPCAAMCDGRPVEGRVRDLSASGLFLATTAPLATGARVTIDFTLPDGAAIRAESTVVWRRSASPGAPAGVGIKLGFLLPEDREALERLVRANVPELFDGA